MAATHGGQIVGQPGGHASGQGDRVKADAAQPGGNESGPHTGMADRDDLPVGMLIQPGAPIAQEGCQLRRRDPTGASDVTVVVLMLRTHVQEQQLCPLPEPGVQDTGGDSMSAAEQECRRQPYQRKDCRDNGHEQPELRIAGTKRICHGGDYSERCPRQRAGPTPIAREVGRLPIFNAGSIFV